jgi:uncharacterized protein with PIN domain
MRIFAETSAVLTWVFDQARADEVRLALKSADSVITSELTILESERAFVRAEVVRWRSPEDVVLLRSRLYRLMSHWHVMSLQPEALNRARQRFPREPVRTLDALHVASALEARAVLPALSVLSLDARVRDNAAALGFEVLP